MKARYLIILLVLTSFIFAAPNYSSMSQVKKMNSFDLRMTDYGSGLGGFFQWKVRPGFHAGVKANWNIVSSGKEYTITDPYTGYSYKLNSINLDFLKTGFFVKFHAFDGKIANTFSPFISLQAGPVLAIDTDNDPFANITRYKDAELTMGVFANIHAGIDFMMEKSTSFTVAAGYETNHFNREIDEEMQQAKWNGASLVLQFGRYF